MVGGATAVLTPRTQLAAGVALLAALVAYDLAAGALPNQPLGADVILAACVLIPATFALVRLALPLRLWRGLLPVGLAFAILAAACVAAEIGVAANFAKLAATTALGFWFLGMFERLSWVVLVAAIIPIVDSISVWRGPTKYIVTEQPTVFDALSFAFPVPDDGAFHLGLPDLLFFALFLAAAARWRLRAGWTWAALVASFGVTMVIALYVDPFGLGGLPALPLLSFAFLLPNADLLFERLRASDDSAAEAG